MEGCFFVWKGRYGLEYRLSDFDEHIGEKIQVSSLKFDTWMFNEGQIDSIAGAITEPAFNMIAKEEISILGSPRTSPKNRPHGPGELDLCEAQYFERQGSEHLCAAFVHPNGPRNLRKLTISQMGIRLNAGSQLSDWLLHPNGPKSLTSLDLSVTGMGDEGARLICEAFTYPEGPQHLKHLSLWGNGITDEGAQYISDSLIRGLTEIQSLSLKENYFGDAGVMVICEAVSHPNGPQHLVTLDLSYMNYTTTGCDSILECLQHPGRPPFLKKVDYYGPSYERQADIARILDETPVFDTQILPVAGLEDWQIMLELLDGTYLSFRPTRRPVLRGQTPARGKFRLAPSPKSASPASTSVHTPQKREGEVRHHRKWKWGRGASDDERGALRRVCLCDYWEAAAGSLERGAIAYGKGTRVYLPQRHLRRPA